MISVYNQFETNFDKVGFPVLDQWLESAEYVSALNGEQYVRLVIPHRSDGVKIDLLPNELDIIKITDPNDQEDYYRIRNVVKTLLKTTYICEHISYDLLDNYIEDTIIIGTNGKIAIDKILMNTQYPHMFKGFSDITNSATLTLTNKNPISALIGTDENSFVNKLGGELKRLRYDLIFNNRIGNNLQSAIRSKKNLTGFERTVDTSTIVTRALPKASSDIYLPEKYMDSLILDRYPHPFVKEIPVTTSFEGNWEEATPEEKEFVYQEMREQIYELFDTGLDMPKVSYKVEFVALRNTEEYRDLKALENVGLGDIVPVFEPDFDIEIKAKVVRVNYDLLNRRYLSIELGNAQQTFTNNQINTATAIASKFDMLDQTVNFAIMSANGKNTNYYGPGEPANPSLGDIWFKDIGDEIHIMVYEEVDGVKMWVRKDITSEDVQAKLDEVFGKAEELKNEINTIEQRVTDAETTAGVGKGLADQFDAIMQEGGFTTIKDAIGQVSQSTMETIAQMTNGKIENFVNTTYQSTRAQDAENIIMAVGSIAGNDLTTFKQNIEGIITTAQDSVFSSVRQQLTDMVSSMVADSSGNFSLTEQHAQYIRDG